MIINGGYDTRLQRAEFIRVRRRGILAPPGSVVGEILMGKFR